jgi:plastocyanin
MKPIRYLGGVALVFVLGCQGMPTVTRTGDVKDIMIGDDLTSGYIAVGPGDEVRWINKRTAPVRIVFLDAEWDKQLSCKNNFGGLMTRSDTAKLGTNETASVCFRDAGTFRYTVRMESHRTGGELNVSGVVKVGGQGGQAVDQTSDQNLGQTSAQPTDQKSGPASDQLSDQPGGGINAQPSSQTSHPTGSTSTTTTTTTTMPAQ